jgi:hypothetical protein
MNQIKGMNLLYESPAPLENTKDTCFSVGTVTLRVPEELRLDFNVTTAWLHSDNSHNVTHEVDLSDFEPAIFLEDYRNLGLAPCDLTYGYFSSRLADTRLTEVHTEWYHTDSGELIPVTLKSAQLVFADGSRIDLSGHITVPA